MDVADAAWKGKAMKYQYHLGLAFEEADGTKVRSWQLLEKKGYAVACCTVENGKIVRLLTCPLLSDREVQDFIAHARSNS